MRVYEFARQIGATYTSVLEMADAGEVEIYSPLSQLDADDVEALKREFQKVGEESVKAKAAAADEKRKEKTAKAAKSAAEKDKVQFEELEAGRKRAAEAYKAHTGQSLEVKEAKPAAKKPVKKAEPKAKPVKIEVTPPPPPKISIQVSTVPEEKPVEEKPSTPKITITVGKAPAAKDKNQSNKNQQKKNKPFRDNDDDESSEYLKGRDRNQRNGKDKKSSSEQLNPRVGGRAGFSSVSHKTEASSAESKPNVSVTVNSREISIRGAIIVKELALKLNVRPNRLITDLMALKVLATINQRVEPDVATKIAQKYGYKVNIEHARDRANAKPVLKAIDADDAIPEDTPEQMRPRPPVVTFLGHVDHGKTTLMDYIRHTKVAAGEAGGITQQISAYQVDVNGRKITFLDTPGHAAFSAMRQRGAQLTDIAVIIIASDDGIMPQTEEAIACARQSGVQMMVAITKCDKPTANITRVMQQLQQHGLTPEEWGGDVVCCPVSGATGEGVDSFLEMLLLQADVLELSANPDRRANGYVVEAELEQGFGPSATILVTGGTLKVGDAILVGEHFGKVRSLIDDRGRRVKEAPPSTPVKCIGLSGVPDAGAEFRVMPNDKRARALAEEAARKRKEQELSQVHTASFDVLLSQMAEGDKRELSIVVKSDTQGSLEAVVESLRGIKSEKVSLNIIGTGTGNVSLTDVKSAAPCKAIIVGFGIGCDSGVQQQARHDGVRINSFRIIYELMDFVKQSMLDMLPPEYREVVKGHAKIKAIYDIGRLGRIAGSQMLDGMLISTANYRILRGKQVVWDGKLQSLRHFKDEV
jgi:translation initiation factor IF-2